LAPAIQKLVVITQSDEATSAANRAGRIGQAGVHLDEDVAGVVGEQVVEERIAVPRATQVVRSDHRRSPGFDIAPRSAITSWLARYGPKSPR
jgi:hypothetical protein